MTNSQHDPSGDRPTPKFSERFESADWSWLAVGLALGVALGVAMDSIGLGLAIGIALGVAMSGSMPKKKDAPDSPDADVTPSN